MKKRVDQDATQEVSASMLVPDRKPPVYANVPKNDASMWMQTPVSADDFLAGPKAAPKPKAPSRSNRGLIIGALAALLVAAVAGGVWYAFLRESPASSSAAAAAGSGSAPGSAVAAAPADAGAAVASSDAAAVVAVADAGAADAAMPTVAGVTPDAVSGADPQPKKSAKKRAPAKKVVKKKTATAPKKTTTPKKR